MTLKELGQNLIIGINRYSPKPIFHPFRMTGPEKKLFDATVGLSDYYLEFGMGGSTFRSLGKSEADICSVDSCKEWVNMMKQYLFIRRMEKTRLNLVHVDIGPTGEWGRPLGDESRELFPSYSAEVFEQIDSEKIDTVLVDGRFRVSCVLKTIMECHTNKRLNILFHDFHREQYQVVLKYLDEVSMVDTLVLLKLKKEIDFKALEQDYDRYKYDSD